jgi:hypothetical protein
MVIDFPEFVEEWDGRRGHAVHHKYYYDTNRCGYFYSVRSMFESAGCEVKYYDPRTSDIPRGMFGHPVVRIHDKVVAIDIGELWDALIPDGLFDAIFKMHYHDDCCLDTWRAYYKKTPFFPLCPTICWDWDLFDSFAKDGSSYRAEGHEILWSQRTTTKRADATKNIIAGFSRLTPQQFTVDSKWREHEQYLADTRNRFVVVHVPGVRDDVLDKGQFQCFGLGVCTVSTRIRAQLPWRQEFLPGVHYVCCEDKFRNFVDIIRWCDTHRDECVAIGKRAREFFDTWCRPERQVAWIKERLADWPAEREGA